MGLDGDGQANKRALDAVGSVTNFLFFAEFVLKAVGLSFEVYFSSSHFNKLDFFIVLTSLADEVCMHSSSLSSRSAASHPSSDVCSRSASQHDSQNACDDA